MASLVLIIPRSLKQRNDFPADIEKSYYLFYLIHFISLLINQHLGASNAE